MKVLKAVKHVLLEKSSAFKVSAEQSFFRYSLLIGFGSLQVGISLMLLNAVHIRICFT